MKVIPDKGEETIHQFVHETVSKGAVIYSDELASYKGTPFEYHWVIHGAKEYVCDDVHTNGIESIWALFQRTYHGTHHHMSPKHLQRYANECSDRLNMRDLSTVDRQTMILQDMEGKKVGYNRLTEGGVADTDIRNYDRPPRLLKYAGERRRGEPLPYIHRIICCVVSKRNLGEGPTQGPSLNDFIDNKFICG